RPTSAAFIPEAMSVNGLSLDQLQVSGQEPREAMVSLKSWLTRVTDGRQAVFVGFNASFDWSFVNWYFHTFVGENPFGISAIDIKSYFMGFDGCLWSQTGYKDLSARFRPRNRRTHNALDDA